MKQDMGQWLSKVVAALSGETDTPSAIAQQLEAARRSRTKVFIEQISAESPIVSTSTIEQVRESDFTIDQPVLDGFNRQLATGEKVIISFVSGSGRVSGESRSLGRTKIQTGGGGTLFGYRLALPDQLGVSERREQPRTRVVVNFSAELELYSARTGSTAPIICIVEDISVGGLKVRSRNAAGRVEPNERVYIKVTLPPPVGLLTEMVHVAYVEPIKGSNDRRLGLRLEKSIEALDELAREIASRRRRGAPTARDE